MLPNLFPNHFQEMLPNLFPNQFPEAREEVVIWRLEKKKHRMND